GRLAACSPARDALSSRSLSYSMVMTSVSQSPSLQARDDIVSISRIQYRKSIPSCASTGSGETIRNDHALPLAAPARSQPNRDLGAVGSPKMSVAPLQFLLLVCAGWVNRRQLEIVEFLQEENRVLCEQLGGRRLRFTDAQRRRLAAKGKALGRRVLNQLGGLVTPDTILRWYRELITNKYDGTARRRSARSGTAASLHGLVVQFATENPTWGYTR